MTNPENIVRVRARAGGRASVYEANGWCQAFTSGVLEGYGVAQNTSADMNVLVGGSASRPDVVLAETPSGYKIALDLVGRQPIIITKPATNKRISAIVAYTDDLSLSSSDDSTTGSPSSCGLIVVNGGSAASPTAPTDTQIRNAITADGGTGSQAAYCVIAHITVASNTTVITNSEIVNNNSSMISNLIRNGSIMADKVDWQTMKSFVPDYGAQTEISLPYTVSAKGFLRVAATGKRVQINGYTVYGTSNSGYVFYSVAPGDAISAPDGADGVTAHFYAGKWA